MRKRSLLGQQQPAAILDRTLRHLREPLQEPWQHYLEPHVVIGNVEMTGRRLPHGADTEDHAVILPALFVHGENRNTRRRSHQTRPQAADRLFATKTMWNRNDERRRHQSPPFTPLHVVPRHPEKRARVSLRNTGTNPTYGLLPARMKANREIGWRRTR